MSENITREELTLIIKEAIAQVTEVHPLTPEETQWVRLAIQAEAERAELRKAIIHKSLAGLVWLGLVALGGYAFDFFTAHWK